MCVLAAVKEYCIVHGHNIIATRALRLYTLRIYIKTMPIELKGCNSMNESQAYMYGELVGGMNETFINHQSV